MSKKNKRSRVPPAQRSKYEITGTRKLEPSPLLFTWDWQPIYEMGQQLQKSFASVGELMRAQVESYRLAIDQMILNGGGHAVMPFAEGSPTFTHSWDLADADPLGDMLEALEKEWRGPMAKRKTGNAYLDSIGVKAEMEFTTEVDPWEHVLIQFLQEGWVGCASCEQAYCSHVIKVIQDYTTDARLLDALFAEMLDSEQYTLKVPVIYEGDVSYVPVILVTSFTESAPQPGEVDETVNAYLIAGPGSEDSIDLGPVLPGVEGINSLSYLVANYADGEMHSGMLKCKSRSHFRSGKGPLIQEPKDAIAWLANGGMCDFCKNFTEQAQKDANLIPGAVDSNWDSIMAPPKGNVVIGQTINFTPVIQNVTPGDTSTTINMPW